MNSQELRALQEAYNQVYELDENRMASRMGKMPSGPAKVGKATHSIKDIPVSREPSPEEKAKARKALKLKESDLYDIILSHLLDEGYADTEQAAEAIMVNMSEDWRESIVEEVLDEAEGSYGQTPKAQQKMGDLANKRRNTPASEYSERGEKKKKVDAASRHFNRMGNPDAGNRGKKSSRPYYPAGRKGMTQKDRDWSRGADEYGHSGYDGEGGGGSLPKGKKLERQRKTGVSD
jgi:hypothetical protein